MLRLGVEQVTVIGPASEAKRLLQTRIPFYPKVLILVPVCFA